MLTTNPTLDNLHAAGTKVLLTGLLTATALNGVTAYVVRWDTPKIRYVVVTADGKYVSVHPKNITIAPGSTLVSEVVAATLASMRSKLV